MSDGIQEELERSFGFTTWLPGQREVVEHLVAKRSALAVFPTGGGKSLCYQLTALLLPGTTLVVSPLIALMKDQLDRLNELGIEAARLDSSLALEESREVAERLRAGRLKLLYVAPERFTNERFRDLLTGVDVSLFAVDEAHCISEWGHNFRPDYLKLARSARECGAKVVLALTATATPKVVQDVCTFFKIDEGACVRTPFHRPNLHLFSHVVDARSREDLLLRLLRERVSGPTIVYVTLQKTAERVAERLVEQGFEARAYHAGLDGEVRNEVQEGFMRAPDGIVVATIAFGMGIDKSDIRRVIHWNLPKSLENYSQEIGRAGRDGAVSACDLFYCPDDLVVLENFVHGDTPEPIGVRGMLEELLRGEEEFALSLFSLGSRHDVRLLVLRTLLTYLELDGILEERTPIYASYKFVPHKTSQEILDEFEGEPRTFLRSLFQQVTKAKKWFHVDPDEVAKAIGSERSRVVRALDHLASRELIDLEPTQLLHRYRRVRDVPDLDALTEELMERMRRRETRDLERIGQVVELATGDGCLARRLAAHFGEELGEDCGTCSRCLGDPIDRTRLQRHDPPIDETLWDEALAVRAKTKALHRPVPFARFLAGITSPAATRARLSRNPLFGAFAHVRYPRLLERAEHP